MQPVTSHDLGHTDQRGSEHLGLRLGKAGVLGNDLGDHCRAFAVHVTHSLADGRFIDQIRFEDQPECTVVAVDELEERAGRRADPLSVVVGCGERRTHSTWNLFGVPVDQREIKVEFSRKMLVENWFADTGSNGDLVHRRRVEPGIGEHRLRGLQQLRTPCRPWQSPATGVHVWLVSHSRFHPRVRSATPAARATGEFGRHLIPPTTVVQVTRHPLTAPGRPLDRERVQRFSRHLLLDEVGDDGQRRLSAARVLVIGAGGLAAPVVSYLSAAGIGHLTVVDDDVVDLSNLQRQVLFTEADVDTAKVEAAQRYVGQHNSGIEVVAINERFAASNALEIAADHDVVVDATDNFPTRYLINDACVLLGLPLVWASVEQFAGRAAIWSAGEGPCYRCVFPEIPPAGAVPSCSEAGVLGVLPGVMGMIQATEVIKLVLGAGEPLIGRMLVHDALSQSWDTLLISADPACPICGTEPVITSLPKPDERQSVTEIGPATLQDLLAVDRARVIDVRTDAEREIVSLPFAEHVELNAVAVDRIGDSKGRILVLHCKSGARSAAAVRTLIDQGYTGEIASLRGGIVGWVQEIDPELPTY